MTQANTKPQQRKTKRKSSKHSASESSGESSGHDSSQDAPPIAKPSRAEVQKLLDFGTVTNPFLSGRRTQIRPMLEKLVDIGYSIADATTVKESLYKLSESQLKSLWHNLDTVTAGGPDVSGALASILSGTNPIGKLKDKSHFAIFAKKLEAARGVDTPLLALGYSLDNVADARQTLYTLESDIAITAQIADLTALNAHDAATVQSLQTLLTSDNPLGRVLLADQPKLIAIVNQMPNTKATHTAIETIERWLIKQADDAGTEKLPDMSLKPPLHEAFFRKKTEILEQDIEDYMTRSSNPKLKFLKKLKKKDYWKILIDGKAQAQNDKHFYTSSKGYMASMMKGLDLIVRDIDKPLSTAFVQQLHSAATDLVTKQTMADPNMPLNSNLFQQAGIKKKQNEWGVAKDFSPDGMSELKDLRDELDQAAGGSYFTDGDMRYSDKPTTVVQWKAGDATMEPAELQATVRQLMDYVIAKGNSQTGAAKSEDAKIGAIIDCCRSLGMIHPFEDANGRLMMFLVLNKLLLQNGMRPTILEDQGLMVGKSRADLVALIKTGQEKVRKLETS